MVGKLNDYLFKKHHNSGGELWFHVGHLCVCPSVCQSYQRMNGRILDRHELGICHLFRKCSKYPINLRHLLGI